MRRTMPRMPSRPETPDEREQRHAGHFWWLIHTVWGAGALALLQQAGLDRSMAKATGQAGYLSGGATLLGGLARAGGSRA